MRLNKNKWSRNSCSYGFPCLCKSFIPHGLNPTQQLPCHQFTYPLNVLQIMNSASPWANLLLIILAPTVHTPARSGHLCSLCNVVSDIFRLLGGGQDRLEKGRGGVLNLFLTVKREGCYPYSMEVWEQRERWSPEEYRALCFFLGLFAGIFGCNSKSYKCCPFQTTNRGIGCMSRGNENALAALNSIYTFL